MRPAGDFLSRFQKLTPPNDALRRTIAQAASFVLGVRVEKGQVTIHNGVAFVDVSNVAKHKLRTERRAVLDEVYERLPKARELVRDVR